MSQRLTRMLWLPLLLLAGQAMALGLGDIRLNSALNEPLRAEIELLAASPEELSNLTVQMASPETFERYGIDRPLWLSRIEFNVLRSGTADGNVIQVGSREPITEPFVTFLVEAVWSRGRLLREYTVLLDPPTFAPPPTTETTQSVTPPMRSTQTDAGRIERTPEPEPEPAPRPVQRPPVQPPVQSAPVEPPAVVSEPDPEPETYQPPASEASYDDEPEPVYEPYYDGTSGGDLRVVRGDTLWGIAQRVNPDDRLTINQVMMAIFEQNPEAFGGNINVLRAGAVLRIPSADDVFNISRGAANGEVQRQYDEWTGGDYTAPAPQPEDQQPSLTLVPPDDDVAEDYSDPSASTDLGYSREAELEDRISELEADVPDQPALLEVRNNELAQLRAELARMRGEEVDPLPVDEEPATDAGAAIDDEAPAGDEDQIFVDEDPQATDDADVTALDDEAEAEAPPAVVVAPAPRPSLLETILGYVFSIWGGIAAAVLVVLGVLVWFARKAAREDDNDEEWDSLQGGDDVDAESTSTARLSALAQEDHTAIVVVEQESKAAMAAEMKAEPDAPPVSTHTGPFSDTGSNRSSLEDTFSSDTAINLDESDPIAEADFHMAYGLHDQAAELINGALSSEPEREDLLSKLCEIYFVWGNRDEFVNAAQRMHSVVGDATNAGWDKIVIMGQQIAADHELFSGKSTIAATRAVDLAFNDGDDAGALDIDLAGGDDAGADVIDLGAANIETQAIGDASSIDFAFDEEDEADLDDVAVTREVAAAEGTEPALDDVFSDAAADVTEAIEDADTAKMPAGESTVEAPTIEQQFDSLDMTGETTAIADDSLLDDDEAVELANLNDEVSEVESLNDADDETQAVGEATAEIDLDELGFDLESLSDASLAEDLSEDLAAAPDDELDETSQSEALNLDNLEPTGTNEELEGDESIVHSEEIDSTAAGRDVAFGDDEAGGADGFSDALDIEDALAATGEMPAPQAAGLEKGLDEIFDDEEPSDPVSGSGLLKATGITQVLPDEFAVDNGTETDAPIADDDATLLAPEGDDFQATEVMLDDAETLMAPMGDEEDEEFDFARTEALPKDVLTGDISTTDETGDLPALGEGSTDLDLDLEDLTAALKVSEVGDTMNQPLIDATVEHPGLDSDLDVGVFDDDASKTLSIAPGDLSDDLHDARTMTEVGTKLDLARAYVDMGDPSGARSILEEVLDEGDDSQRQQAQQLLDSLPS